MKRQLVVYVVLLAAFLGPFTQTILHSHFTRSEDRVRDFFFFDQLDDFDFHLFSLR
ncbi:hypothetical protein B4113_1877 [Geobacillus sp. B4113_201601]|nr:hypothetical protein B4113_1877 [Geobacillus sp. B4113_201601]